MKFGDEVIEGLKSGKRYRIVSPTGYVWEPCIYLEHTEREGYVFYTYCSYDGKIRHMWMDDFSASWLFADDWEESE